MTKLNPTKLAEQHKKDQIKARNREYQKLYYKLHKKEILKKKKKKREEAKSDNDDAETRAAPITVEEAINRHHARVV